MNDLALFLWRVFLVFTVICLLLCVQAHFRYQNRRGIDDDRDFNNKYRYFGQSVRNRQGAVIGYELLLREFNPRQGKWQLPHNVADFPLSRMITAIREIDWHRQRPLEFLVLNLTVYQVLDFRIYRFFNWVLGVTGQQRLTIELSAHDIIKSGWRNRHRLRSFLKQLNHHKIQIVIEDVDSSQQTYRLLQQFLPYIDGIKFDAPSFEKSQKHWIDKTLGDWQRRLAPYHIISALEKIEGEDQIALANQLQIDLRQGYAFDRPRPLDNKR